MPKRDDGIARERIADLLQKSKDLLTPPHEGASGYQYWVKAENPPDASVVCPHCGGQQRGMQFSYDVVPHTSSGPRLPPCSVCYGAGKVTNEHARYYHFGRQLQRERVVPLEELARQLDIGANVLHGMERGLLSHWKNYLSTGHTVEALHLGSVLWTSEKEATLAALQREKKLAQERQMDTVTAVVGHHAGKVLQDYLLVIAQMLVRHAGEFRRVLQGFDQEGGQ